MGEGGINEDGVEFLGELDSSFYTYSSLSSVLDVIEGDLNTSTNVNKWLKFRLNNKQLIISRLPIRTSISYNTLYALGLVFGTNDNGQKVPTYNYTAGPINQFKIINIGGYRTWCQDFSTRYLDQAITRGQSLSQQPSVASITFALTNNRSNKVGWRPCLELVS